MSPAATEFLVPSSPPTALSRSSSRSPRSFYRSTPSPIKYEGSKSPLSLRSSVLGTNHPISVSPYLAGTAEKLATSAIPMPRTPKKRSLSDDLDSSPPTPTSPTPRKSARSLIPKFAASPDSDLLRFLVKNRYDDESSRDSGFESNGSGISSPHNSETSSNAGSFRQTKNNQKRCSWKDCARPDIGDDDDIWDHLRDYTQIREIHLEHFRPLIGRGRKKADGKFSCLWIGCKAFNTPPTRGDQNQRFSWLQNHVLEKHGGPKPHKCIINGCSERFPSKISLNTHLASGHNGPSSPLFGKKVNFLEEPEAKAPKTDLEAFKRSRTTLKKEGVVRPKFLPSGSVKRRRQKILTGTNHIRIPGRIYLDFVDQRTVEQLISKVAQEERERSSGGEGQAARQGANGAAYSTTKRQSGKKGNRINAQTKTAFLHKKTPSHETVGRELDRTRIQGHLALLFPDTLGAKLNRKNKFCTPQG